jgi:hypothetical protein
VRVGPVEESNAHAAAYAAALQVANEVLAGAPPSITAEDLEDLGRRLTRENAGAEGAIGDGSGLVRAGPPPAAPPPAEDEIVDLDQIAALLHLSKASLGTYKRRQNDPLPDADYPGGAGRRDHWRWSTIHPWLVRNSNIPIPDQFPDVRRRR